jgi:hypothetical protein
MIVVESSGSKIKLVDECGWGCYDFILNVPDFGINWQRL